MTPLEQRYRRVLRLLPASYRRRWEEDMVLTFLHSALPCDAEEAAFTGEHGWPASSEVASVAALAVRLRLGGAGAPPRYLAWGGAVRRVALVGLLAQAVLSLLRLGEQALYTLQFPVSPIPEAAVLVAATPWWSTASTFAGLLWVPAYLTLLGGHRRTARALAVSALLPQLVSFGVALHATDVVSLASHASWLLLAAVPVLATAAFHRDAPAIRARPWLLALPVGVGIVTVTLILAQSLAVFWFDLPGLAGVSTAAAGLAYLAAPNIGWGGRSASWSIALSVVAAEVLGLQAVTLEDYLRLAHPSDQLHTLLITAAAQTATTLAITAALVIAASRALNALPPHSDAMPAADP